MLELNRYKLRPAGKEDKERLIESEGAKSIAPLDCFLGIAGLPFKMSVEMMLECAFWAQDQASFQRAEEKILRTMGLFINDDTVRLASNYIGRRVFENNCLQAKEAWDSFCAKPFPAKRRREGVLYIEVDGAAVNTRHKDSNGSTWRENKLAVFFSSDNIYTYRKSNGETCRKIQKKEYVPYIGCAAEFKKHVLAGALRNGHGEYRRTVVISDGAGWIANMKDELFGSDAVHILDFFHLAENVYSYGKAKFNMDERAYKPWAEKICKMLKAGEWRQVLNGELAPEETYPNTANLYHYINENKERIDYPRYLSEGFFIGSGAVESSNKTIVQKRLKQAGMRWNPETAQYMLTLVAKWESGLWNSDVAIPLYDALT